MTTRLVIGLAAVLLLSSCITRPSVPTYYYSLEYSGETERPELYRTDPFNASVLISDTAVSGALSRPQLVERGIGPRFEYLENQLWGVQLSDTVSGLLLQRMEAYGLFRRVDRDLRREPADYEARSTLSSVEYIRYGNTRRALVRLDLSFWDLGEERRVVGHRAREERAIFGDDVSIFVSTVNRIIHEEIDEYLSKVARYMETGEPVLDIVRRDGGGAETADAAGRTGILLLPALAGGESQPFYTILGSDFRRSAQFGEPVDLPSGSYSVLLGSGPADRRMRVDAIEVIGGQRTVVEPTWAALTVNVVNRNRDPARVRYDVYGAETGRNYGGRISRSEAVLTRPTVWILRPGKYKLILNNRPFNTLRDFVTVTLIEGRGEDLTVVVEQSEPESTPSLVGAGNVAIDEPGAEGSPLGVTSAINATLSFTADNESAPEDFQLAYFLDSEVDTELTYEAGPLQYELRNTVALGFNASGSGPFTLASDELDLRNTLVYSLTDVYGVYARVDLSTTIFGRRIVPDEPLSYVKRGDGATVESVADAAVIRLSPPLLPVTLQEGVGLNVSAVETEIIDLGFRAGIGATQVLRYNVYQEAGSETIDGAEYVVYESVGSEVQTGIEASASASARLPFDTAVSTTLDLFAPFAAPQTLSLQWESVVNIVLIDNISLYYRLTLTNEAATGDAGTFVQDHGVFLRMNYLLRERE